MGGCASTSGGLVGAQEELPPLSNYDTVRVIGVSDISVNGREGMLVRWMDNSETSRDDGGRWVVLLSAGPNNTKSRQVALHPSKLRFLSHCSGSEGTFPLNVAAGPSTAAVTAGSAVSTTFFLKDRVRIINLSNDTKNLEGKVGTIMKWLSNNQTYANDGGRFVVRLKNGNEVSAKPVNLTLLEPRPLLSPGANDIFRTDYTAAAGADAALGDAFNTQGTSNAGVDAILRNVAVAGVDAALSSIFADNSTSNCNVNRSVNRIIVNGEIRTDIQTHTHCEVVESGAFDAQGKSDAGVDEIAGKDPPVEAVGTAMPVDDHKYSSYVP